MTILAFKDAGDGYYQVDIPDGAPMPEWTQGMTPCDVIPPPAETGNALILSQIAELEASVTDRRIREAVLGIDGGWLKGINDKIKALRASIK